MNMVKVNFEMKTKYKKKSIIAKIIEITQTLFWRYLPLTLLFIAMYIICNLHTKKIVKVILLLGNLGKDQIDGLQYIGQNKYHMICLHKDHVAGAEFSTCVYQMFYN